MEYGATVWDPYQKYNSEKTERVQRGAARFWYTWCVGVDASLSKETGGSTYSVFKIINGMAQVPFEGVLVEAYKGTRRKHNMKFIQIGHTTSQ